MLNTNYLWIQYIQRKERSFQFPANGRKYESQCILSTQYDEENLSKIPSFQQFFFIFLVFLHANSTLPMIIHTPNAHTTIEIGGDFITDLFEYIVTPSNQHIIHHSHLHISMVTSTWITWSWKRSTFSITKYMIP